jgi:hypothetical protein
MEKEQPVVRIFCKANTTVSAAVHDGRVTLVSADANDKSQVTSNDHILGLVIIQILSILYGCV